MKTDERPESAVIADGSTSYDAFLSYSHAADDLLAPRLQSALQRFAKPWWQRRAIHVFRDESTLTANPHLWSSITHALDASDWFVLLLSPDAAASEWVNREIAYWVEHRDQSRILPVVTDGDFGWGEGDVVGSAVPAALRGVFLAEPRSVDLRGLDTDEEVDLKNPAFAAAVADIASAIRGVPKDELASEEVHQHRRTVRTAWAAGIAVTVFGVLAGFLAVSSTRNANEAERQAQLAAENAAESESQAELALQNEAAAVRAAGVADGRRLLSSSLLVQESDAELAMLLALQAHSFMSGDEGREEALAVLRQVALAHRLVARIAIPRGVSAVQLSPDGSVVYHASDSDGRLVATDVATGQSVWEYRPSEGDLIFPLQLAVADRTGSHAAISISPGGDLVAVAVGDGVSPGRIVVLDASSGSPIASLSVGTCPTPYLATGFSAGGLRLVAVGGSEACMPAEAHFPSNTAVDLEAVTTSTRAYVYDIDTWDIETVYSLDDRSFETLLLSRDARSALMTAVLPTGPGERPSTLGDHSGESLVVTYPGLEPLIGPFGSDTAALSPSRTTAALLQSATPESGGGVDTRVWEVHVVDARNGDELFSVETGLEPLLLPGYLAPFLSFQPTERQPLLSFSPDSRYVSVVGLGNVVIDTETGRRDLVEAATTQWIVLRGRADGATFDQAWSGDSGMLVTAHDGELLMWAVDDRYLQFRPPMAFTNPVSAAAAAVTRSFTQAECITYNIDPCPTLDEIRDR